MTSTVQIPNLPAVVALAGSELFEGVQAGTSVKITLDQITTYVQNAALPELTFTSPLVRTVNDVELTTVPVTLGGSGVTTLALNGVLYGNAASALGVTAAGTTGQVLVAATGAAPAWGALSGIAVTSISGGTTGITPAGATTGAVTLAGTLVVANGGTGVTTLAANGVLYGNGASAMGVTVAGTTGQVLVASTGAAPAWGALSGIAVTTFSAGTTGLTPNSATSGVVTLAGTLVAANGGTSFSTYATGDLIYASAANTLSKLAAGTDTYLLTMAAGVPTWAAAPATGVTSLSFGTTGLTPSSPTTGAVVAAGTLVAANGGTSFSTYATGDLIYASAANTLSKLAAGTDTYLLTMAGGVPSWAAAPATGVTSWSGGTTGLTPSSPTTGAVVLAGTLAVANGGTGITSFGTGVATALGINVGSAGAFVTFDGALGTPSSGTLTNATGLPISTGVSGLGANVATWLGTPSSANLLAAVTDETGTGPLVFAASPTLTGTALANNITASGVVTGASVTASNAMFINSQTVAVDYTIAVGYNALSAGPVTVNSGITVTVSSGSAWGVV